MPKLYGQSFYQPDPTHLKIPRVEKWKWTPTHGDLLNNLKQIDWDTAIWDTRKSKQPFVLVIAERDIETGGLLHTLYERQIPFLAIAAPWLSQTEISWEIKNRNKISAPLLSVGGTEIDAKLVKVCYWRWGAADASAPVELQVEQSRWKTILTSWALYLNEKCLMLPGKLDQIAAPFVTRFSDLNLAQSLGILIPDTLVSQDVKKISAFFKIHKGQIVLRDAGQTQKLLAPRTLRIRKLKQSELPKKNLTAPAVFQKIISSRMHLRAVVVQEKLFCAQLEILGNTAELDWRRLPVSSVGHTEVRIPKATERKLLQFARESKMQIAAFDLILSPNGDIYFLEMNRPGRWFYLELFAGLKLRSAISDLIQSHL